MAKKASKIRAINNQIRFLSGLMVAAMSGRKVEIRTGKPSLHSKMEPLPKLGLRPVKVIKKSEQRQENETCSQVAQKINEVDRVRVELRNLVPVNNHQTSIRRSRAQKFHPMGEDRLSSRDRLIIDHKRERHPSRKGTLKLSREFAYI